MINAVFSRCSEIRMGSPFSICDLHLEENGREMFKKLDKTGWQDYVAIHESTGQIALIYWNNPDNKPGFRIIVLERETKPIFISSHIAGCCTLIAWEGDNIAWASSFSVMGQVRGQINLKMEPTQRWVAYSRKVSDLWSLFSKMP